MTEFFTFIPKDSICHECGEPITGEDEKPPMVIQTDCENCGLHLVNLYYHGECIPPDVQAQVDQNQMMMQAREKARFN